MKLRHLLKHQPVSAIKAGRTWEGGHSVGELLPPETVAQQVRGVAIGSIHYRAQEVRPGGLFVAMAGQAADGHNFIRQALERGAAAVICQHPVDAEGLLIQVPDSRRALSRVSARFFDDPSRKVTLIGVTGTNGKTTVTYLLERMLAAAGIETGVIGTVNYRYGGKIFDNPRTTPESTDLQRIIAEMQAAGIGHVIMEVASHGIALHRTADCHLDVAVFTNLTQDHLDFHGDMAAYWDCKRRLFTKLLPAADKPVKTAVVNGDDARGAELLRQLADLPGIDAIIGTGRGESARLRATAAEFDLAGIRGELSVPGSPPAAFDCALVGRHNLQNILSAAGAASALGLDAAAIVSGVEALDGVPGRLERVPGTGDRTIFVDYAHTPDALDNVLAAVRALTAGRLICVFGCGGDRDRAKRPLMGEKAAHWSDLAVVTSDNPRSESPQAIIDMVIPGVQRHRQRRLTADDLGRGLPERGYVVEADRRRAIALAVAAAGAGDAVVIAGKGHETYQELNGRRLAFDDRQVAREVLAEAAETAPEHTGGGGRRSDWSAQQLATAGRGELICADPAARFTAVSIDSRTLQPGQVFVAIRGETHDGHRFLADAVARGAGAVLFEARSAGDLPVSDWRRRGLACIAVADTTRALGDLARFHRDRCAVKVVAITGSNGKTSTRRMIAGVLSQRCATLATRGNFNNAFGLPLTLLRLTEAHQWAVVELGMNHPGEIRHLTRICRPDIGVITNIGPAHLAFFETVEAIAGAKAELLQTMAEDTDAVVNIEEDRRYRLTRSFRGRVTYFGTDPAATVVARNTAGDARGINFELKLPEAAVSVTLATPAVCMAVNAAAAAAVGRIAGCSPTEIQTGLMAFKPVAGRMQTHTTAGGVTVLDDSYNANPASMGAAIATLAGSFGARRRILVAGDMLELGEAAADLHRDIGRQAGVAGLDRLFVTGQFARQVAEGAESAGMSSEAVFVGSREAIVSELNNWLQPGDWVVVKGSRAMGMEVVVDALTRQGDR